MSLDTLLQSHTNIDEILNTCHRFHLDICDNRRFWYDYLVRKHSNLDVSFDQNIDYLTVARTLNSNFIWFRVQDQSKVETGSFPPNLDYIRGLLFGFNTVLTLVNRPVSLQVIARFMDYDSTNQLPVMGEQFYQVTPANMLESVVASSMVDINDISGKTITVVVWTEGDNRILHEDHLDSFPEEMSKGYSWILRWFGFRAAISI